MSRRVKISVALAVLLLVPVAAAYAWDSSRSDRIAEGVRIGHVDVGGLSEAEARRAVDRRLVSPLRRPLTVRFDGVRYRLKPDRLGVRADIDGMVEQAIAASRDGGLHSRVWRYATGGEVAETVEPRVAYSKEALREFVAEIEAEVNRDPVDAAVEPSPTQLLATEAEPGLRVRTGRLTARLRRAAQSPSARSVRAPVEEIEPEVTAAELAAQYPHYLTVDRSTFTLRLFENLELSREYTIAVGAIGYETPTGVYHIQTKAVDPAWHVPEREWAGDLAGEVIPGGAPKNPLKARWLGIYNGVGVHGTDDVSSLGSAASHGCIRMAVPEVIELYDVIPVGTPIYIQ